MPFTLRGSYDATTSLIQGGAGFLRWNDHTVEASALLTSDGFGFHRGCDLATNTWFERLRPDAGTWPSQRFQCYRGSAVVPCNGTSFWPE
jgi:hypothetical protein